MSFPALVPSPKWIVTTSFGPTREFDGSETVCEPIRSFQFDMSIVRGVGF